MKKLRRRGEVWVMVEETAMISRAEDQTAAYSSADADSAAGYIEGEYPRCLAADAGRSSTLTPPTLFVPCRDSSD
jgi:hypothetical protein